MLLLRMLLVKVIINRLAPGKLLIARDLLRVKLANQSVESLHFLLHLEHLAVAILVRF